MRNHKAKPVGGNDPALSCPPFSAAVPVGSKTAARAWGGLAAVQATADGRVRDAPLRGALPHERRPEGGRVCRAVSPVPRSSG